MPHTTEIPLNTLSRSIRVSQTSEEPVESRILIAGVGNRLMGDDGFGPRVIELLESNSLPWNVEIRDIGTAGLTIATDLGDYELVVFIDSMNIEGEPGKLVKEEVKVEGGLEDMTELSRLSLHEVGLEGLLRFSKAIGTLPSKIILIGCKPRDIGPSLELSPEVNKATYQAVVMVHEILESLNQMME